MKDDIREYARLGLVHHMLFPECMMDPDDHVRTLKEFLTRDDIETLDFCLPYGEKRRDQLIPLIRDCGKEDIAFATHLFPLSKSGFGTPIPAEQAQARMIAADMIESAAAAGATGFIFASGKPSARDATPDHYSAFADFCRWLCGKLKPYGVTALLEPFDTIVDKKYLYGSTEQCMKLIESLCPEVDNLGIELDMGHLPLMGESFSSAIRTVTPNLKRVHLGNCVLRDKSHPFFGDTHPPIGFPPGEIDVPEVTEILRTLIETGFLDRQNRGSMLIEMTPWPGKSVEETVKDSFGRLENAWNRV